MRAGAVAALCVAALGCAAAQAQPASDAAPTDCAQQRMLGVQGLCALGLGAAVVHLPVYRGARSTQNLLLPVPYLHYEGPFLRADRHGVRGELFASERLDLTISASLSPPVLSRNASERAGMPNLKPTVEIGPQLDIELIDGRTQPFGLRLRLPLRQALTLERSPRSAGLVFAPNLNFDVIVRGWNLGVVLGPIFADRKQHALFYDVEPAWATATRPAYRASGGYSGTQWLTSASRRVGKKLWLGAYLRYDSLHRAAFAESPLVAQKKYLTGGVALIGIYQ